VVCDGTASLGYRSVLICEVICGGLTDPDEGGEPRVGLCTAGIEILSPLAAGAQTYISDITVLCKCNHHES